MGTRKSTFARMLTLGCAGIVCLGSSFTWTGFSSDLWDVDSNWTSAGLGYPSTTDDDATIPKAGRSWGGDPPEFLVLLITEQIDDLAINEDTDFQKKSGTTGTQTLTCDSVEIYGDGARVKVRVGVNVAGAVAIVTN